jgi:hypothetical protein
MSEQNQLSPDWVTGLEGETVICEDVTIRLSTSLPILEGYLSVTCTQGENGKSISQTDNAQSTMARGVDYHPCSPCCGLSWSDYQIEHQPSYSGGAFERDMHPT